MVIPKTKETSILIGLTGDVMIGRLVDETLSHCDPSYLWGNILPLLHATDLNLINLEAALTRSDKEVVKMFNFKAAPEKVDALTLASIDVANLANNHSLDYSYEGLLETLHVLDHAGIRHVGAGKNSEEAKKPLIVTVKGISIGILGCTDNEPSWKATECSPGTHFIDINEKNLVKMQQKVKNLRDHVDCVILTIHWGPNMRERPPEQFRHFARGLIDSGVDIFHGHSAHIFQGVEIYQGRVIFYDTGDFVDDYYVDPRLRNDRSFFFLVELGKEGIVGIRLIPVFISHCQVNTGKDNEATMERMVQLSKEMGTTLIAEGEALIWTKP